MNQTMTQQETTEEERKKLARANIRLALLLGAVVLFALFSTFYFLFGVRIPM